jgi:hypothetical protein
MIEGINKTQANQLGRCTYNLFHKVLDPDAVEGLTKNNSKPLITSTIPYVLDNDFGNTAMKTNLLSSVFKTPITTSLIEEAYINLHPNTNLKVLPNLNVSSKFWAELAIGHNHVKIHSTVSKFLLTGDSIKTMSKSNPYPDCFLDLISLFGQRQVHADIKTGTGMTKEPLKGTIGQITYDGDTQVYIPNQTRVTTKTKLYTITTRGMKTLAKGSTILHNAKNTERLSLQVQSLCEIIGTNNKANFISNCNRFANLPVIGENSTTQALLKGTYSRWSEKKSEIFNIMKSTISHKVDIADLSERTDMRFMFEAKTASRFSNTSESIRKVTMQNEKPSLATIGNNKNPDICLTLNHNGSVLLDIKAGNNLDNVFRNLLAEINYTTDNRLYTVTNSKSISLKDIQQRRLAYIQNFADREKSEELKFQYSDIIHNIEAIIKTTDSDLIKNILIQEEIFRSLSNKVLINHKPSFYYGHVVNENSLLLNVAFHKRLAEQMNNDMFSSKDKFTKFMSIAIKIYSEEVQNIIPNIERNKDFWQGTGFENIANDLFS